MWFLRWLILAIVFMVLLYFGFQNAGLVVHKLSMGSYVLPEAPLLLVLLAAFLLGLVVMFVIAAVEHFKLLSKLRGITKERDQLLARINSLQKIPLDQIDEAFDVISGSKETGNES